MAKIIKSHVVQAVVRAYPPGYVFNLANVKHDIPSSYNIQSAKIAFELKNMVNVDIIIAYTKGPTAKPRTFYRRI